MERTVTMSLAEYEELKKKVDDAERILKECEKSSEERGYLVRNRYLVTENAVLYGSAGYEHECAEVEIKSAQEVTQHLVEQIAKWKDALEQASNENKKLKEKIYHIYHRNLWQRIINSGAPCPGFPY